MTHKSIKIRDGFRGEQLISIPESALRKAIPHFIPYQPYVTHIGYFPKAMYHYRQRIHGCKDDILFYCLQGKGYYILDHIKYELNANQFVIIPATTQPLYYWADANDPWSIYWIHFTGKDLESYNKALHIGEDPAPVYIPVNEEGLKIWSKMYESIAKGYSVENLLYANLLLNNLIASFIFPQKCQTIISCSLAKDIVEKTIAYMNANPDKKLMVKELALMNNLSSSYFSKIFRSATGMSPIDYFIHVKMQKACHLLYTTDYRIKRIAMMVGYDDCYYFSRLFKKANNLSPEEYRASVKKIFE